MNHSRVVAVHRTNMIVRDGDGNDHVAVLRGVFHESGEFPVVGDYVLTELTDNEQLVITDVVDRKNTIERLKGERDTQVIAANIDRIFIVMGVDGDFNPKRLQRYLLLASQNDIPATVILNKIDLIEDVSQHQKAVEEVAGDVPLILISAATGENIDAVHQHIQNGETVVFLGSSGAGKSTLTNQLLGEVRQETQETRVDDNRGRHTTTTRELFSLPNGACIIDTPGMRELGMAQEDTDARATVFAEIAAFAADCKFRNCDHDKSDGCAVKAAVVDGSLSETVYQNYLKLAAEESLIGSGVTKAERYKAQGKKREAQKRAAMERARLSKGLR